MRSSNLDPDMEAPPNSPYRKPIPPEYPIKNRHAEAITDDHQHILRYCKPCMITYCVGCHYQLVGYV